MPKVVAKTKGSAVAAGGAKKAKSKLYNMPEKVKEGTILRDLMKTEWKIGPSIGVGGFGEIYSATKKGDNKYDYVIKCEPHDNGPLFVEMHFYMRNAKLDDIKKFQKDKGLKSLGMPYMVGNGSVEINGIKHRFIVMPRYGSDVAKHFLANGRRLPEGTAYRLALQMIDVYEFIHSCGYVHADLKAANILLGYGKSQQHQAYLVDFGLASHYTTKDFRPDPKKMHNGTIEYTSRDAHLGVPTMRADLEILGYNLIEWLGIELPWVKEKLLAVPTKVQKAKEEFMSDVGGNLRKLFLKGSPPTALSEFMKYVAKMEYNEMPDYEKCRKFFHVAVKTLKVPLTGDLNFKVASSSISASPVKTTNAATTSKPKIKKQPVIVDSDEDDDQIINASDEDDDDVLFTNSKINIKKLPQKSLKTEARASPIRKVLTPKISPMRKAATSKISPIKKALSPNISPIKKATPSSLKRTKHQSSSSSPSPSPPKRSKTNGVSTTPLARTRSPSKQATPVASTSSSSSAFKHRNTPINAKANIRMSPAITMSSSRSGKTVINDNITPNKRSAKTYEFNFELDVSMDANVIVNVKRKKKPLQPSQEYQQSPLASSSTPVTRVKVKKVASAGEESSASPRTPSVTVKKTRRAQNS